jgi:hypothetical protein
MTFSPKRSLIPATKYLILEEAMSKKPYIILLSALIFILLCSKPPSAFSISSVYDAGELLNNCERGFGPPLSIAQLNILKNFQNIYIT